jgi:K+/H+ antiporter YhaU regulatory subunit KhtT
LHRSEIQPSTVVVGDAEAAQQPHVTLVFTVPASSITHVEQALDGVAEERPRCVDRSRGRQSGQPVGERTLQQRLGATGDQMVQQRLD